MDMKSEGDSESHVHDGAVNEVCSGDDGNHSKSESTLELNHN